MEPPFVKPTPPELVLYAAVTWGIWKRKGRGTSWFQKFQWSTLSVLEARCTTQDTAPSLYRNSEISGLTGWFTATCIPNQQPIIWWNKILILLALFFWTMERQLTFWIKMHNRREPWCKGLVVAPQEVLHVLLHLDAEHEVGSPPVRWSSTGFLEKGAL